MQESVPAVVAAVSLFFLGLLSPGPNFFVVTQRTLSRGRKEGIFTALGVVAGDTLYASAGLIGLSALIQHAGAFFVLIKIFGGVYLTWLGARMLLSSKRSRRAVGLGNGQSKGPWRSFFVGFMTDLANPKTVLFFSSVFAVTLQPGLPVKVPAFVLIGIVMTSVSWRITLVLVFSVPAIRKMYERFDTWVERVFGTFLILFGARLAFRATRGI